MRMNMHTKLGRKPSPSKPKKARLNLYVDAQLLEDAKEAGVNLSAIAEQAIRVELARSWYEGNKVAIDAFNEDVSKNGLWSDGLRTW
jgi:antitoxin CcdA